MKKNIDYVVISELSEIVQKPFREWLINKPRPIIEEEGDNQLDCAYQFDYDRWLNSYLFTRTYPPYNFPIFD